MLDIYLLIASYAFLGGAIKFVDQAYDEGLFSRRTALVVALFAGLVMGLLMAYDSPFSTAFYVAMLISLVLARKIDNTAFYLGTAVALAALAVSWPLAGPALLLVPMALFLIAGFVDEVADGWSERRGMCGWPRAVLAYRPFSDLALVAMMLMGIFGWAYLLPYFAFTLAYLMVTRSSDFGALLSMANRMAHLPFRGRI